MEIETDSKRARNRERKREGEIKTSETVARIVLVDYIFRAMTHQVQYMAIHCTTRMQELNFCTNTRQNLHVKNDAKI